MALTSAEATTCLSVSQASSIQSIGGTCESITIGHNRCGLSLAHDNLYLPTCRPKYLCERLLEEEAGRDIEDLNTSPHSLLGIFMGWKRCLVWEENESKKAQGHTSRRRMTIDKMVADKGLFKRRATLNQKMLENELMCLDEEEETMDEDVTESVSESCDIAPLEKKSSLQAFMDVYSKQNKSILLQGKEIEDVFSTLDRSRHGTIGTL